MNRNNPNSSSLPRLLILSFSMSSQWTKTHSFFPFSFTYRESLKERRLPKSALITFHSEAAHTEYAWEETLRGDSYQALTSFLKRSQKDSFLDHFPWTRPNSFGIGMKKCKLSQTSPCCKALQGLATNPLWSCALKNHCSPHTSWAIALGALSATQRTVTTK